MSGPDRGEKDGAGGSWTERASLQGGQAGGRELRQPPPHGDLQLLRPSLTYRAPPPAGSAGCSLPSGCVVSSLQTGSGRACSGRRSQTTRLCHPPRPLQLISPETRKGPRPRGVAREGRGKKESEPHGARFLGSYVRSTFQAPPLSCDLLCNHPRQRTNLPNSHCAPAPGRGLRALGLF